MSIGNCVYYISNDTLYYTIKEIEKVCNGRWKIKK